jgi:hypothetical protein
VTRNVFGNDKNVPKFRQYWDVREKISILNIFKFIFFKIYIFITWVCDKLFYQMAKFCPTWSYWRRPRNIFCAVAAPSLSMKVTILTNWQGQPFWLKFLFWQPVQFLKLRRGALIWGPEETLVAEILQTSWSLNSNNILITSWSQFQQHLDHTIPTTSWSQFYENLDHNSTNILVTSPTTFWSQFYQHLGHNSNSISITMLRSICLK